MRFVESFLFLYLHSPLSQHCLLHILVSHLQLLYLHSDEVVSRFHNFSIQHFSSEIFGLHRQDRFSVICHEEWSVSREFVYSSSDGQQYQRKKRKSWLFAAHCKGCERADDFLMFPLNTFIAFQVVSWDSALSHFQFCKFLYHFSLKLWFIVYFNLIEDFVLTNDVILKKLDYHLWSEIMHGLCLYSFEKVTPRYTQAFILFRRR